MMSETNRMDINLFCKALGQIYSRRFGLKVTVRAEQKETTQAETTQVETQARKRGVENGKKGKRRGDHETEADNA